MLECTILKKMLKISIFSKSMIKPIRVDYPDVITNLTSGHVVLIKLHFAGSFLVTII